MDIEKLYHDYFLIVYRYIFSICKNPDLAEEITQETFFKIIKNISKLKQDSSFKYWAFKIAKNTYLDWLRKQNYQIENIEVEEIPDKNGNNTYRNELLETIYAESHKLKEPYRSVFIMRVYQDVGYKDIAKKMKIKESMARKVFQRAKEQIREKLNEN